MRRTNPTVYLAGPVENVDNHDWREDIIRDFPETDFVDPMDWSDVRGVPTDDRGWPTEEPSDIEIVAKCEEGLSYCDGMLAYTPAEVKSDGTAMEIRIAHSELHIPVVAYTTQEDQLGSFVKAHVLDVEDSFEDCLHKLQLYANP